MVKYKILGMILIVLGIVDFIYYIILRLRGVTFTTFFFITSILGMILGILEYFNVIPKMKNASIILKSFKYVFLLVILSFFIVELLIVYWGQKKYLVKADYVIILGAGVRGTTPSLILYERLKSGLKCIDNNPKAFVVLSGGKGPGEDISEAEAMRRYLLAQGVDEKRIILEDRSEDTEQNILYSKNKIMKREGSEQVNVLLVTSNFHMFRAGFLLRRAGFHAFYYSAPIPAWLIPAYYIREYFAVFKSYIFDRVI